MKQLLLCLVTLLGVLPIFGQEMSKKEKLFWEVFNTNNIESIKAFNKDDFIKNNYWFKKHPIIESIKMNNYNLVDYFLSESVRNTIEIDDRRGKDILEILASEKQDEGVLYLLSKRTVISGEIILSIIKQCANTKILDLLIQKTGDINNYIGNYSTYTLLSYSIIEGNDVYIEYLINKGCDLRKPYYTIKMGQLMYGEVVVIVKTPLDLLVEMKKSKFVDIIVKMNAKTFQELINEDDSYGLYLSNLFSEIRFPKYYTYDSIELKEFPREKSMTIRAIPKKTTVYLLDQSEKELAGDHYSLWYLVCTKDGIIGWAKNTKLFYPSEM